MKPSFIILAIVLPAFPAAAQSPPIPAEQTATCTPTPGEGVRWIASCEAAFKAGDARAALTLGKIYWNGDGVPKDSSSAAQWWKMADQEGRPEAAKLLGDEAYVRAMMKSGACPVNPLASADAIAWYQKAMKVEPDLALRKDAQARLDQFLKLESFWPPACKS